jgi:hypothetical protein
MSKAAGSSEIVELPVRVFIGKLEATSTWSEKKLPAKPCMLVFSLYEKGKLMKVVAESADRGSIRVPKAEWAAKKYSLRVHAILSADLMKQLLGTTRK